MTNYKNIKDIRTEMRGDQMWKIIIFQDGSKEEKIVNPSTVSRIISEIENSLKVVPGGKIVKTQK